MVGSSQPVAGVGVGERERETAAAGRDQDDVEHQKLPFKTNNDMSATGSYAMLNAGRVRMMASARAKWIASTRPISRSTSPGAGKSPAAGGSW
jgi:hypothetical protein